MSMDNIFDIRLKLGDVELSQEANTILNATLEICNSERDHEIVRLAFQIGYGIAKNEE